MKKLLLFLILICQLVYSQQITQVQYWFGDNFANRITQPISTNASNETDLSLSFPDNGTNEIYDLIHYRFSDSNNNWSSIYSQPMFDANDTNAYLIQMEYWFDNDFANRSIALPTQFMGTNGLDHQEADITWQPNAQTIHYRFKSKYNQWSSIQSSNIDNIENINNKIAVAEFWLNNDFASRQIVNNVAENNSFFLDIRNVFLNTDVQETINLRYKDKMNRWSSIYSFHSDYQGDEIEPSPIGTVNLVTSKLPAGKINLVWNSVENAKLYLIYRDGLYWRSLENTHHPQSLEATDFPALGNHSYYVVAKNYLNPTSLTSNTDDETIEQSDIDAQNDPANIILYGTLNGIITDANGNRIDDVLITYSHDGYSVFSNLGQFKRDGVLYGTQGTLTLSKAGYSFTPVSISNYDLNEPIQTLAFIGTSSNTSNPIAETQVFSLEQSTGFTILTTEPQFKQQFETVVTIKNIGNTPWSGKIQLIAKKIGTTTFNTHSIIDEVQVSNLAVGEERIIEFTTSQLELTPANYAISLLAYRFENDINSTIQNIIIGANITQNNFITVTNPQNLITKDYSEFLVKQALNSSIFITRLAKTYDSAFEGSMNEKLFNDLIDELELVGDFVENASLVIDAIGTIDAFMTANEFKDYWSALTKLSEFCNTPLCKVLTPYMEVTSSALNAIDNIKNSIYPSSSAINFASNATFKLKIVKSSSFFGLNEEYFERSEFINEISSINFVLVNGQGIIQNEIELEKINCDNAVDTQSLCFSGPQVENLIQLWDALIKITWVNGKITYVPFKGNYFAELPNSVNTDFYVFKLNAKKADGNTNNIKAYAFPNFN